MDNLYQEMLEKEAIKEEAIKEEVNISLGDDEIISVLMRCHAGQSCEGCPYDELHTPRCRNILLNECIGLVNRLKKAKEDVATEIFEEISKASADWGCYCITSTKWGYVTHDVSKTLAELKKKYTEGER